MHFCALFGSLRKTQDHIDIQTVIHIFSISTSNHAHSRTTSKSTAMKYMSHSVAAHSDRARRVPLLLLTICATTSTMSHAATIASTAGGSITAPATWDGAAPTAGNDYVAGHALTGTDSMTFAGDSLTLNSGSSLTWSNGSNAARTFTASKLNLNGGNVTLNGSGAGTRNLTVSATNGVEVQSNTTIRLANGGVGANLTLNTALSGSANLTVIGNTNNTAGFNINFANSAFSGNWDISATGTGGVALNANQTNALGTGMVTLGTRGILTVSAIDAIDSLQQITISTSSSVLNLTQAWDNASAALNMTTGTLNLGTLNSTIGSFTLNGNAIGNGTYDASQLTAMGFGGTFSGTGTLTVVPEPSVGFLAALSLLPILRRRRAQA